MTFRIPDTAAVQRFVDLKIGGGRFRFCMLFGVYTCMFAWLFQQWEMPLAYIYLQPVSAVTAAVLNIIGITAHLDTSSVPLGFCIIALEHMTFRVIHECTGIFTLFIYLAATLAYPADFRQRVLGVVGGVAAFFAYSCLRLTLLGVVAQFGSGWVTHIHMWLILVNPGYALLVWLLWAKKVTS